MPFIYLISKAVILWDRRIMDRIVWLPGNLRRSDIVDHIYQSAPSETTQIPRTDMDAAVDIYLSDYPGIVDWYDGVLAQMSTGINWRDQQPLLSPNYVTIWERLCNDFDPDALLTFDLVRRYGSYERGSLLDQLKNWRTVVRVGDHELSVMWKKGITDLHVHFGGVRLPQLAWLELLTKQASIALFSNLVKVYRYANRKLRSDRDQARKTWLWLISRAGEQHACFEVPQPQADRWWRWSSALLNNERRLFARTWTDVVADRGCPNKTASVLDQYLSHKHRFFRLVRQQTFSEERGLRQFDLRYFSALKRTNVREKWSARSISYGSSARIDMAPYGDSCRYLFESNDLRKIELRISPFKSKREYLLFFKRWSTLEELLRKEYRPRSIPQVRFAIHFQRTRKNAESAGVLTAYIRTLVDADRESAALRSALASADDRHRRWMGALSRIDVAGQERDSPAALFGVYLRLLRGDPDAINYLDNASETECRARHLECWTRLKRRGEHRPSLGSARLGMTVHAGEDFVDVLDGLYQVASAIERCGLEAGDGIGHGLSLVAPVGAVRQERSKYALVSVGAAHDSVCWLYSLVQKAPESDARLRFNQVLCAMIIDTAKFMYGETASNIKDVDVNDYVWVWDQSILPRAVHNRGSDVRMSLLAQRISYSVIEKRERYIPVDPRRLEIRPLVEWAQTQLLAEVKRKRIVIEMNPSSNMRVYGAASLADSPTVRLFQEVSNGLLACVNSDDPGVFTSCIENEYALLLRGAIDAGMEEGQARSLLERVRSIGQEAVYWPPRGGNGGISAE